MTTDQLRQICVDYLQLSVSFQWTTDRYISFNGKPERTFYKGKLYGGIPYINTASGNLYRILEYYDEKTGHLDTSFFKDNPLLFGTACSGTASMALYRVVNSAELSWTHSMNVAHGFIPVGDYKYDHSLRQIWETGPDGKRIYFYNLKHICRDNGEQVMFESYAKALPADCFSSNGHVRLAVENPVVVRLEDGTIDGENSYAVLGEQGLYTKDARHKRTTSDGTAYLIRGTDRFCPTFKQLFDAGYVVHTFAEFLGTKPVERGTVSIGIAEKAVTAEALCAATLKANFPISDIFTTVCDANGNEIYRHVYRSHPHFVRSIPMTKALCREELAALANGENTVEMKAQLANGEKLCCYSGTLLAD